MKSIVSSIVLILVVFTFQTSFAQNTEGEEKKLSLDSGTIEDQFDYVIKKSGRYQEYKVVKRTWMFTLKEHVLDSLTEVHKELNATQNVVNNQNEKISELQNNLSNTQQTLDETNKEKDSMALFGMQMSKTNYSVLLWSIIGGLVAFLILFIYKFKNSNGVTKAAKHKLEEVELEFEEHRRSALEREQKVRRQLQDELNKQKA